jgi:tetratricopeptide (TPR) repeat protein
VADALHNLSNVLIATGRHQEALDQLARAVAILERERGSNLPMALVSVGTAQLGLGRHDEAIAAYRQAHLIWERERPDHPSIAYADTGLAEALVAAGRFAEAVAPAERAIAAFERSVGAQNALLGYPLTALGAAHLGLNKAVFAVPPLERAVAVRSAQAGDPLDLAASRLALARALRAAGGDPARAVELARQAEAAFRAGGERTAAQADQAAAFASSDR